MNPAICCLLFLLTFPLPAALAQGKPATAADAASRPSTAVQEAPRRGRRQGDAPGKTDKSKKPRKPRPGIAVKNDLIQKHCALCHQTTDGMMGRLSFLRKSPEGWSRSIKRMIRHHDLKIPPSDAREMVRYLANDHGLTHGEAERSLYYSERRVHWSEKKQDADLRKTCAACHTLGRVLNQQRDAKEWSFLKATHLAFFPLANSQAFRGSRSRSGRSSSRENWAGLTEADREARMEEMRNGSRGSDRADKVLGKLAKDQPLFSAEWKEWEVNRREIRLQDVWSVVGYEPSKGEFRGQVTIMPKGDSTYETLWELIYDDGTKVSRKGRGILYAGYSWRGSSAASDAAADAPKMKEVLLLNSDWQSMRGRLFGGEHAELGMDVRLYRRAGNSEIFNVRHRAIHQGAQGHTLVVHGDRFPKDLATDDFFFGRGVTVTAIKRLSSNQVECVVDVARDATMGERGISIRAVRGPKDALLIYDTVDYIKVMPREGFARVGGKVRPKQMERFWAVAMSRGVDGKLRTKDDLEIYPLKAKWALEEFHVRPHDDDVNYVGAIDETTGLFTPAAEGPNVERKWSANNIGDVYVKAQCELRVPVRVEKKEASAKSKDAPAREKPAPQPEPKPLDPLKWETKTFQARGHLLVTVPLYIDWDRYDWDQR